MIDPTHLWFAPHLDDAVLSCGGTIAGLRQAGQSCAVVTLAAGLPTGARAAEVERRQVEDRQALALLGAEVVQLNWLDHVDALGAWGAPTRWSRLRRRLGRAWQGLRDRAPEADSAARRAAEATALVAGIVARWPTAQYWFPLGIGRHPDHLATLSAGFAVQRQGCRVGFYADLPYACSPGATARRLVELGGLPGWHVERVSVQAGLAHKARAIACYGSQLAGLHISDTSAAVAAWHPDGCELRWVPD